LCWKRRRFKRRSERRAAIFASLEWHYIVDDLSELSEVEVEQEHWDKRHDSDASSSPARSR
jgi:hypothetical protein